MSFPRRGFLAGVGTLIGVGLAMGTGTALGRGKSPQWRPELHFTPERNWMNDPNGLVFHQGEYHLFFQHNPKSTEHANLSWGHAVSTDLSHWEELPVALLPDELGEIYSGSAVVDHDNTSGFFGGEPGLVALYTSAGQTQQQSLAYSTDRGRTWTKYEGNPVIPNPGVEDFRDPKVIRYGDKWVLMLAAGDRISFYESPDLVHWKQISEFGTDHGSHGGVWECPDLFELPVDGDSGRTRWVLIVSINPGGPAGGSATQYFVGDFDGTTFTPDGPPEQVLWAEQGADFYAPQSWSDVPDRRIWVGWLSNWDYAKQVPTEPWRGAMTVPRTVSLATTPAGVRLVQRPVEELDGRRGEPQRWRGVVSDKQAAPEFSGAVLDIVAEFRLGSATSFGLDVFVGDSGRTRVGYDVGEQELFVDRTKSGSTLVSPSFPARHAAELLPDGDVVRLRLLIDRSTVEVFGGRGETVLTDLVLPDAGEVVRPFAEGGEVELTSLELFPV